MVRERRGLPVQEDCVGRIRHRQPRVLVDDREHVGERAAARPGLGPSGQGLRHVIHELHAAELVGRDDRIADTRQGHPQPRLGFGQRRRERLGRGARGVLALALQHRAIEE